MRHFSKRPNRRVRFRRNFLIESLRLALDSLKEEGVERFSRVDIARRTRQFYVKRFAGGPYPKMASFRYLLTGKTADPELLQLIQHLQLQRLLPISMGTKRHTKLDRDLIRKAFELALERKVVEAASSGVRARYEPMRPQKAANLAHKVYCRLRGPRRHRPSVKTFRNLVAGKNADPCLIELLNTSGIFKRPVLQRT